jgi:hypothetical protein
MAITLRAVRPQDLVSGPRTWYAEPALGGTDHDTLLLAPQTQVRDLGVQLLDGTDQACLGQQEFR